MKMSNKTYDIWKFIAQYVLPAVATAIVVLPVPLFESQNTIS